MARNVADATSLAPFVSDGLYTRPRRIRNITKKIGICAAIGKHDAIGLTLCSW